MINRELIRIKIVQLVYAYEQNGSNNIDRAEKELIFSLSKAYHLYNYLLLLIVAITKEARHHVEIGEARARREGKPMPSAKFANNKFVLQLEENRMLNEFVEMQKLSWDDDIEFVRKLYSLIVDCETYKEYMASDDDSYDADRELWRKLYKLFIMDNDDFESLLEEKSLYWNDDKEVVDTFVLKTIRRFDPSKMTEMELLPEFKDREDRDFAIKLFRASILNASEYQGYMGVMSQNWEFGRLALMDIIIMQVAIAEMLSFPGIPVNVTINEYVELAKVYSTGKSAGYVNGMIDSIARQLVSEGKLQKPLPEIRRRNENKDNKD
jgi:N utilization substance protein B